MNTEMVANLEPLTFNDAMQSKDSSNWKQAMQEEMDSLIKNQTWELVDKPKNQKLLGCKWIFKLKQNTSDSNSPRYKTRLVAKGFNQKKGWIMLKYFLQSSSKLP